MDALVRAALAGTARGVETPAPDTPAGALAAQLPDLTPERRLLLLAGAGAVYRQTGRRPATVAAPDPAPEEHLPVCPPAAARLIREVAAGQHVDLLPEALGRLRRAGLRLPPGLVPAALALGVRDAALRPALLATMGERGPWLAAHNTAWRWAAERLPAAGEAPPADAETIWQEGKAAQRLALLRVVRAHDPARGREWLAAVWTQEKAEFRAEAITTLEAGLSGDDEAFLEAALDDRGKAVRTAASRLLARLPGSALAARMRERADALLDYTPPAQAGGLRRFARAIAGGGQEVGTLRVTLPDACDPAWQHDGVEPQPPMHTGERAWWLIQTLAVTAPSHWAERFGVEPDALIAAALRDAEWGSAAIEGWTRAAILHEDPGWSAALWGWWALPADAADEYRHTTRRREMLAGLVRCLPQQEAERLTAHLLGEVAAEEFQTFWGEVVDALPRPWNAFFSDAYLTGLRAYVRQLDRVAHVPADSWKTTLPTAAVALAPSCFARALDDWEMPDTGGKSPNVQWNLRQWRSDLDRFSETIRLRQRLMKEIPL
ncbi:MAG TPA: DUF5691 domain-containing protein [Thermomicrobiales bacterium]|nr:DUF5691 domain-containing protein [Thermomicrobiales bacterium]